MVIGNSHLAQSGTRRSDTLLLKRRREAATLRSNQWICGIGAHETFIPIYRLFAVSACHKDSDSIN